MKKWYEPELDKQVSPSYLGHADSDDVDLRNTHFDAAAFFVVALHEWWSALAGSIDCNRFVSLSLLSWILLMRKPSGTGPHNHKTPISLSACDDDDDESNCTTK